MQPVLTPAEMAEADRRTIAAGTPVEVLMERAGRAVAWAARRMCGGTYGRRAVVVCGKGNNGGDGLVAARVLRDWGMRVDVFELQDRIDRDGCARAAERADLAIDAMYGTGFTGELTGDAEWVADVLFMAGAPTLAVDIPSGVDGLTGEGRGGAVAADETVTFAALKSGLLFDAGASLSGSVHVADIGIDVHAQVGVTDPWDVWLSRPRRPGDAHKWMDGVMVVGGSGGMTGAPLMVSHAAMRAGAGIVWCCVPGEAAASAASGTEVITKALPATGDGALDEPAAAEVLKHVDRFKALVVGPGLGRDERTAAAVRRIVAEAPVPLVLDADGLNVLGGDLGLLRARTPPTVVTPHDGEYERLAGAPVGPDRIAAARGLAEGAAAEVLLKGPTTVIAEADGGVRLNRTGGEWLATAGTGDVLSGVVGAFVAAGAGSALERVAAAAWVHGRAADHAGHEGLVASDLIDALPPTLREIDESEGT